MPVAMHNIRNVLPGYLRLRSLRCEVLSKSKDRPVRKGGSCACDIKKKDSTRAKVSPRETQRERKSDSQLLVMSS